jgi:signal transduction histidine kinase
MIKGFRDCYFLCILLTLGLLFPFFSCKSPQKELAVGSTVLWEDVNNAALSDSSRAAAYSALVHLHTSQDSALLLREALRQITTTRPDSILLILKNIQEIRCALLQAQDLDKQVVAPAFMQQLKNMVEQYPLYKNSEIMGYCYLWLTYAYSINGQLKEGAQWVESNKSKLSLLNPKDRSSVMLYSAQIYVSSGQYLKAIEYLNHIIQLAKQHNLYFEQGQAYSFLGDIFFLLDLSEKEKEAYRSSIPALEACYQQDKYSITKSQIHTFKIILAQNEAEALAHYDSAAAYIRERNFLSLESTNKLYLANFYWKNKQLNKAIQQYQEVIQLNQKFGTWSYAFNNQAHLCKLLLQNGQINEAIHVGVPTAKSLDSVGFSGPLLNVYQTLSYAYAQKQRLDSAFFYQKKKDLLAVEVDGSTQATTAQAITFLEKEQAANKIISAQLETQAAEAELERQKKVLIWLAVGLIVFSALAFVYYLNNKIKQKAAQDMEAANKALLNEQEKLKRSNEQLYRFTRVVSHDVITNLDLILSAGNIYRVPSNDPNPQTQYYAITQNVSRQLKDYCVELLEESRKEKDLDPALTDPMPLIQQVLDRFQPIIQSANVQVEVSPIAPMPLPTVIIEQLFQNLISNTLRYGVTAPQPTLRIAEEKDALGRFCCIVEDNGPGIPADQHEQIFDTDHLPSSKGQGIGLSLLRTSLRQHNADIWVEDRPGGGTRWVILYGQ